MNHNISIFHQNASVNVAQYKASNEMRMTQLQDSVTVVEVQLKKQKSSKEETQISKNRNNSNFPCMTLGVLVFWSFMSYPAFYF